MVFRSGLKFCNPLHTSVGFSVFPVTMKLWERFNSASVDRNSSQIISMSYVLYFVILLEGAEES